MKVSVAQVIENESPENVVSFLKNCALRPNLTPEIVKFLNGYLDVLIAEETFNDQQLIVKSVTGIDLIFSNSDLNPLVKISPDLIAKFLQANSNLNVSAINIDCNHLFAKLADLGARTNQPLLHLLTTSCEVDLLIKVLKVSEDVPSIAKILWTRNSQGHKPTDIAKSLLETRVYESLAMSAALRHYQSRISI